MSDMRPDALKRRLERDLLLSGEAKSRIWGRIQKRIVGAQFMHDADMVTEPVAEVKRRVWARILHRIEAGESKAVLEKLRELLSPPPGLGLHMRGRFLLHGRAQPQTGQYIFKWVAALVILAIFIKAGPQVFIAPHTVAEEAVTLMPTRGEVAVSVGNLWQPVDEEIVLEPGTLFRTHDGEASMIFRDDAVLRLGGWTTVQVHDTADPAQDMNRTSATLTLVTGSIWIQGLIPSPLNGIGVRTDYGLVTVNEGSVSIREGDAVEVKVWDRGGRIEKADQDVYLVAGERAELKEEAKVVVKKILESDYSDAWVLQNLDRDAVHRKSISQMQQERRSAAAGILPTSILYPAKRIAEKVDVLLTFGEEAKTQKKLEHAGSRLDEAVALLGEGAVEEVKTSLDAYRNSLLALATGSGDDIVRSLIDQSLAAEASGISAVLPDEDAYLIKQSILEAGASIPYASMNPSDVEGILLVDTVSALLKKLDEEGAGGITTIWSDLSGRLKVLSSDESGIRPEVQKEARVLLSEFAFALEEIDGQGGLVDSGILEEVRIYLPPSSDSAPVFSEEEIMRIVQGIRDRIFVYHMARSRINQLNVEFKALEGHPDQGRILRKLRFALPDGPEKMPLKVRKEIIRLQWDKAG